MKSSAPHRMTTSFVVFVATTTMLLLLLDVSPVSCFSVSSDDDAPLIDVDSIVPPRTNIVERRSAASRRMAARLLLRTLNDAVNSEPFVRHNYFIDYGKPGGTLLTRKRVETEPVSASRLAGMLQGSLRTRQGDGVKLDTLRFGK